MREKTRPISSNEATTSAMRVIRQAKDFRGQAQALVEMAEALEWAAATISDLLEERDRLKAKIEKSKPRSG